MWESKGFLVKFLLLFIVCSLVRAVNGEEKQTEELLTLQDLQTQISELKTLYVKDKLAFDSKIKVMQVNFQEEALKFRNLEQLHLLDRTEIKSLKMEVQSLKKRILDIERESNMTSGTWTVNRPFGPPTTKSPSVRVHNSENKKEPAEQQEAQLYDAENRTFTVTINEDENSVSRMPKLISESHRYRHYNNKTVHHLDQDILKEFRTLLNDIFEVQSQLNDLRDTLEFYNNCTSSNDLRLIKKYVRDFNNAALQFKLDFKRTTYEVQSGNKSPEQLRKVSEHFNSGDNSPSKMREIINFGFARALTKIVQYKLIVQKGIHYYGRFGNFKTLRETVKDKIIYAIFFKDVEGSNWENNWNLFGNQLSQPFSILAVVDCELGRSACNNINKTVIKQYYRNKLVSADVYAKLHDLQMDTPLFVSALGRDFALGTLYDANTDQFFWRSIFKKGTKLNTSSTNIEQEKITVIRNSFQDKMEALNIQPPKLRLNVLINPENYPRSGKTFMERRGYSPNSVSKTIVHTFNTIEESIPDPTPDYFEFIDIPRLSNRFSTATHFVQKIIFGGITTISLTGQIPPNVTETQVVTTMDEVMDKIKRYSGFSKSSHDKQEMTNLKQEQHDYSIDWASDSYQKSTNEFGSFREMVKFVDNFEVYKSTKNGGVGVPVTYVLYPIKNLQKFFGVIPGLERTQQDALTTDTANRFADLQDDLFKAKAEIQQIDRELTSAQVQNKAVVTNKTLSEVKEALSITHDLQNNLTQKLTEVMVNNNNKPASFYDDLLTHLQTQQTAAVPDLDQFFGPLYKISTLKELFSKHPDVKYLGKNDDLEESLKDAKLEGKLVLVLFYKTEFNQQVTISKKQSTEDWDLFTRTLEGSLDSKRILWDCDFNDEPCQGIDKSTAHLYKDGILLSQNVRPDMLSQLTFV